MSLIHVTSENFEKALQATLALPLLILCYLVRTVQNARPGHRRGS